MKFNKINNLVLRALTPVIVLIICFTYTGFSQDKTSQPGHLKVFGKVKSVNKVPNDLRITVYKDNVKVDEYKPDENGRFDLKLDLNSIYYLQFSGNLMFSKTILVNTTDSHATMAGEYEYKFNVNLVGGYESDAMAGMLKKPVVKILYNSQYDGFDYDRSYDRAVREQTVLSMKSPRK